MAWSSVDREGRVGIPDGRQLWLKTNGSARSDPSEPAIVLVHGLGGAASEWSAVQRRVAQFARVCLYERAGYHGSDVSNKDPTPTNIASDLMSLLRAAEVTPPYLLVGHSYGGVIARQFLHDHPADVAGLVLVDSVPVVNRVPGVWTKLLGEAKYEEVIGLIANLGIDREEFDKIQSESAFNETEGGIASQEVNHMHPAEQNLHDALRGRQILGSKPLNVIFCDESNDFQKIYDHGLKHNHGTSEEREIIRKHLIDMSTNDEAAHKEHLSLSSNTRFVKAVGKRATHNVHLVDPAWIASEIEWAYNSAMTMERA